MAGLSRRGFLAAGAAGMTGAAACVPVGTAVEAGASRHGVLREPARDVKVIAEYDVCVVGGSCTGVFAAVAASRLGAKACVIENLGFFGGVATASLVNIWHSKYDTAGRRQIFAGLTTEVMDRLDRRGAVVRHEHNQSKGFTFNSAELILELDALLTEANVTPYLHTRFVAPVAEGGKLTAVIIEDKTGRRAIRARRFIDASGDGDVAHRTGLATYKDVVLQPPTVCAVMVGLDAVRKQNPGFSLGRAVFDRKYPEALKGGFLWSAEVPGLPGARMVAGTRVHGADLSDAAQRTAAEIEGRRQVRAMMDLVRNHLKGGDELALAALPARIGIRESRHVRCLHTLTENEVLTGTRFEDAVVNGSYRVDVHHPDKPGLTFRYLDGAEVYVSPTGGGGRGRWRDKTDSDPTFYQVPYRSLVPKGAANLLVAGRCLDADRGAFGAVRVMVNCNQMGQAAGAAAYLSLDAGTTVDIVDMKKLRKTLEEQGAIVI